MVKTPLEYVTRRLCERRGVHLDRIEDTPGGDARFLITNGEFDARRKAAWCPVGREALRGRSPGQLVEMVTLALEIGVAELQGVALPMSIRGTFRIHFNRHGAAPLVWCVATDEWELAVATVSIRTAAGTHYQPKATPDAEDGKPSAWIVATGVLTISGSEAIITGGEPEVQTQ